MNRRPRRCSYIVNLDADATGIEVEKVAAYLSTLGSAGCEVVVLDRAAGHLLEGRRRVLRWVGRHEQVHPETDLLRAAVDLASNEKIIIAAPESRYSAEEVSGMCDLLDRFEAVEPEEFVQPLPWWGGIDAGRILLDRGVARHSAHSTFAFRKSAWSPHFSLDVHEAREMFIRREPPVFRSWIRLRQREEAGEFQAPIRTAFFLCLFPLLLIMALVGGVDLAGAYASLVAFGSVSIAVRGRIGAAKFFPLRACLYAPLWVVERSISAYWALFARFRRKAATPEAPENRGNLARNTGS